MIYHRNSHEINNCATNQISVNNHHCYCSNVQYNMQVEYVDDQSRDYSRMFPAYEQVSFSSRAPSPLSEFEHRVSPLDPNMSSAARYSPTPVPLPPLPFHNSVVVLQSPPSPLIVQPEADTRTNINFVAGQSVDQGVQQTENVADFVNNSSEEGLVSTVGGELILMQGALKQILNFILLFFLSLPLRLLYIFISLLY